MLKLFLNVKIKNCFKIKFQNHIFFRNRKIQSLETENKILRKQVKRLQSTKKQVITKEIQNSLKNIFTPKQI